MCGIVGYIGNKSALDILLEGLTNLEYRGYDSAGVAVNVNGQVELYKAEGKLQNLKDLVQPQRAHVEKSTIGIGHIRWATHGAPTTANAHPHSCNCGKVAVVHNGIIENYKELREKLEKQGCTFRSQTDTETVAHLVASKYAHQSTNDAYPSAGKIAIVRLLKSTIEQLDKLYYTFIKKADDYGHIIKMGRTEMQDAVPISFGQVFHAYASAVRRDIKRFELAIKEMTKLNMGGTAVGTGINADHKYIEMVVPILADVTGLPLVQADDLVDATQNLDSFVYVSGIIKSCAATLSKISNDLRLMSSGPRTGFAEINLLPKQNGSSIMPGKINPVIPEVMNQICFNIIGNDTTITYAAEAGQLELNAFEPIAFRCLFESLDTLRNGVEIFIGECVSEITVNPTQCRTHLDRSIGIVTALCPYIGYTKASQLAKQALRKNRNIRDVVIEENIMTKEEIDKLLDPSNMI